MRKVLHSCYIWKLDKFPFTGIYVPSTVEYQFTFPAQTNQYMYDMGVLGSNINDTPAIFDDELLESYSNKELTNLNATLVLSVNMN